MKVETDRRRCTGHGRCYAMAPDVFEIDDLGYNLGGVVDVPPGLEAAARRGAEACPEEAIRILEDGEAHGS